MKMGAYSFVFGKSFVFAVKAVRLKGREPYSYVFSFIENIFDKRDQAVIPGFVRRYVYTCQNQLFITSRRNFFNLSNDFIFIKASRSSPCQRYPAVPAEIVAAVLNLEECP